MSLAGTKQHGVLFRRSRNRRLRGTQLQKLATARVNPVATWRSSVAGARQKTLALSGCLAVAIVLTATRDTKQFDGAEVPKACTGKQRAMGRHGSHWVPDSMDVPIEKICRLFVVQSVSTKPVILGFTILKPTGVSARR